MSRTSWLNKHLTPSSSRSQRRQAAQKRRPVRLALEPLEDRVVPTGGSVSVSTGHQLAAAVNANNSSGGNVTITVANSLTLQNNSTGSVEITKGSVTILGQGNTLTAASVSRLFQVDKGASLTIQNATLTGGNVTSTFFGTAKGGAILDLGGKVTLSGGAVVLSNVVNANGPLSETAEGGGVFVSKGGSLTIAGGYILNNNAIGSVNIASTVGHAVNNAAGGGVFVSGGSTLSVESSYIIGNLAQGSNAIVSIGPGGVTVPTAGIALGGGVFVGGTPGSASKATFTSSSIYNNTAQGGAGATPVTSAHGNAATGNGTAGGEGDGGGIYASTASLTLTGNSSSGGVTQVYSNQAVGGAGGNAGALTPFAGGFTGGTGGSAYGGGIDTFPATALSISYSSFYSNTAQGGAGGLGGKGADGGIKGFAGGSGGIGGTATGGGVDLSIAPGVTGTVVNSSFTSNSAIGGTGGAGGAGGSGSVANGKAGATGAGGFAHGGGVAITANAGSLVNIINATVATNTAQGASGSPTGIGSGAGIWFAGFGSTGAMQLINDTVYSNTVKGGGTQAGGVYATLGSIGNVTAYNTLFLNNVNSNTGYSDTNLFVAPPPGGGVVGSGNYVTTSFLPTIKVVSSMRSSLNGLVYYALQSGTAAVNGGVGPLTPVTGGTLAQVIAKAQGVTYNPVQPNTGVTDEIGNARFHTFGIFGITADAGAVSFIATAPAPSAASTSISVGNVNITTSNVITPLTFIATVTANSGNPVTEGVVTFTVENSQGTVIGSPVQSVMTGPGTWSTTFGPSLATTYTLPGNTPAGTYFILATYSDPYSPTVTPFTTGKFGGSTNSTNPALLTISQAPVAPIITTQPKNATAVEGSTVLFTAAAIGTPPVTVQWQVSTDGGATFTAIAGATSNTLTLTDVALALSDNQYEAVFTNASGSVTTTAALLTVTPNTVAPTVTLQPSNLSVVAGSTAVFTTSANGTPTPTVQWQVSTDGGATYTSITGATSTTLALPDTTTDMSNDLYRAVFTNSAGTATTNSAMLHVAAATVAPTVTTQPANVTVVATNTAVFTVAANGTPTPTVQWYFSTDGGATYTSISGATSTTLTLTNTTTNMTNNLYRAVFTNSAGTVTSNSGLLTVNANTVAPTVTVNPVSQSATVGTNVLFTAAATGTPTPTVQWYQSTDGGATFTSITGATNPTLTLTSVTAAMSLNQYEAVFTNSAGTATTTAAQLTVTPALAAPTITLQPKSVTVAAGNTAVFTASATGNPTPTVQWFVSSDKGATFSPIVNYPGVNGNTLTISNVPIQWNGYQYRAVFTNSIGTATTNSAQATVTSAVPVVIANVTGSVDVNVTSVNGKPPSSNPLQFAITVALDTAALLLANNATAMSQLNGLSLLFLGTALPPTSELLSTIQSDLDLSSPVASFGMQLGYSIAGIYSSMGSSSSSNT